jgi:hypothetical protein
MKAGRSLTELAQELEYTQEKKLDLVVPTRVLNMNEEGKFNLLGDGIPENVPDALSPNNWASSQIATYTNIPKAYYDRIKAENSGVLSHMVNHGLQMAIHMATLNKKRVGANESRMVRTLDGNIRGFLSSRYRRLDSADLLETVLPVLNDNHFQVVSSELTDRRMYLKVTTDRIQGEVKKGMIVQYGLVISSSDVGCGSVRVEPLMYECWCDNGCISQTAMRKFHVGKDQATDNIEALLSDATKEMDDEVFWRKTRDVVVGSMEEINFQRELNLLKEAHEVPIENMNLERVVDLTMKEVGITGEKKKHSILQHLASGADGRGLNKYGLCNAFTYAAHQAEDINYEEATELERAGGKIIVMPKKTWTKVACKE